MCFNASDYHFKGSVMSHFRPVALDHASRLLNHGPTVLITSRDERIDRRNVMAAAWSMPVEFSPARIAIVVDKSAWSRELIEGSGMFGIVVPGVAATNWTYAVGSVTGREEDKFNCYGIPAFAGPVLGLPVIEEKCLAWLECRLLPPTAALEKYDTLFGEVVSAAADERAFVNGHWQFDEGQLNTIHHLGGGNFVTSGRAIKAPE
jgi:flavin reductase (DIM6/NTAB) family NADH-FMN oxidoreductase RutF